MAAEEYYDHVSYPLSGSPLSSAAMRAELASIEAGFAKLPDLAGNQSRVVVVNPSGSGLTSSAASALTVGRATVLDTARTINGTSFDGSANITTTNWGTSRTLSFTGDVTGSAAVNGSANVATAMTLANSGVAANTYGGNNSIPSITVDAKGRVTAATTVVPSGTYGISVSGNAATVTNGVYTTGDQTIGGTKTFSNTIVGSVNGNAGTVTNGVYTTGNQTIGGIKTFSSEIVGSTTTQVSRTVSTGSAIVPTGTTAQRDGSPLAGYFRFNATLNQFEGYNGTAWGAVGGGATGAPGNAVFYENEQEVTGDYTIPATRNAMSAGPIEIATGVTVTVSAGATWSIV